MIYLLIHVTAAEWPVASFTFHLFWKRCQRRKKLLYTFKKDTLTTLLHTLSLLQNSPLQKLRKVEKLSKQETYRWYSQPKLARPAWPDIDWCRTVASAWPAVWYKNHQQYHTLRALWNPSFPWPRACSPTFQWHRLLLRFRPLQARPSRVNS